MGITSAIVLFAVIWFLVMFVVLPIRRRTQGDDDDIVPGTMAGSPTNFDLRKTMLVVTGISIILWLLIAGVILSGVISIRDLDWFGRMGSGG